MIDFPIWLEIVAFVLNTIVAEIAFVMLMELITRMVSEVNT